MSASVRRRHCARWTPEEDAILRQMWGQNGSRAIREALGRTELACVLRAQALALPPQTQGMVPVTAACKRLGLCHDTLYLFLRDCGTEPSFRSPVRRKTSTRYRRRVVELEQVEALLHQRDTRTTTLGAWAVSRGIAERPVIRLLARRGLALYVGRQNRLRVPEGVLEEVYASGRGGHLGTGLWCAVWSAVIALEDRPCVPWLIALLAHDMIRLAPEEREWIEWAPQAAREAARRVANDLGRERPGVVRAVRAVTVEVTRRAA